MTGSDGTPMLVLLAASLLLAPAPPGGGERALDQVVLEDGKTLEGYVLHEGRSTLILLVGTREREIPLGEVKDVRSVRRSLDQVLDQHLRSDPDDPLQMLELARFARSRGLDGLADVFTLRVLVADPGNAEAHEQLGHRQRGGQWTVKGRSRSVAWDRIDEFRSEWRDGWELHTPHWDVYTNLGLAQAVDATTDLEHYYRGFYDLIGEEVTLRDVVEPMRAEIYADHDSFPKSVTRSAYFQPAYNTLIVDGTGGVLRELIFHEATHQLFYNTATYRTGSKGCVPAWLNEGTAVYLATAATGLPGRAQFDFERVDEGYFGVHRDAEKPYKLSRVLTLGSGDFLASSRVDLKYAQAYTLVHFLLHGEGGRYRRDFHRLLEGAYEGKCSGTYFKQVIETPEEEFEAAWHAHAGR